MCIIKKKGGKDLLVYSFKILNGEEIFIKNSEKRNEGISEV